jgi:ABC-type sugar transport system permease subunit
MEGSLTNKKPDVKGRNLINSFFRNNQGFLFILPALILFFIFVLYPIYYIVRASFLDWTGLDTGVFVGFQNYIQIFTADRAFKMAMRNSFYWTFLTIFPQMFLGFILAYILNQKIFYMPAIISPVVIAIVWIRIYNPFGGLLSDIGMETGLKFLIQPFLSDPKIAIFSAIAVNVWQWTGWSMLLYLAGLQGIPEEVMDAASVDGAKTFQRIRHIIWPLLDHVHKTLILLGVIGTLQTFALIFQLTNGGPNHATEMLPTYIFKQGFELQSMGYASALSVILLVLALILSLFQVIVLGSRFSLHD